MRREDLKKKSRRGLNRSNKELKKRKKLKRERHKLKKEKRQDYKSLWNNNCKSS